MSCTVLNKHTSLIFCDVGMQLKSQLDDVGGIVITKLLQLELTKGNFFLIPHTSGISRKQILILLLVQILETRAFYFLNIRFLCTK